MTYETANKQLQGRYSQRRKIGNNTWLERRENSAIALRLHNTDILVFLSNGDTVLNSGGWHTVTTKSRINEHMSTGWGLSQKNYDWYLRNYTTGQKVEYQDSITITAEGCIVGVKL